MPRSGQSQRWQTSPSDDRHGHPGPVIEQFSFANDAKGDAVVPNPVPAQIRGSIHSTSSRKCPRGSHTCASVLQVGTVVRDAGLPRLTKLVRSRAVTRPWESRPALSLSQTGPHPIHTHFQGTSSGRINRHGSRPRWATTSHMRLQALEMPSIQTERKTPKL